MDEGLRKDLIDKLTAMRELAEAVRKTAGLAAVESCMRFADFHCVSALWNLGAIDFWEYELDHDER